MSRPKIPILIILLTFIQCSLNKTFDLISNTEEEVLVLYQQLDNKNKTVILDTSEKGENLLLCLTFIDKKTKKELPNQVVKFFHTSTDFIELQYQNYNPNIAINGMAITDNKGRIFVKTILQKKNYGVSMIIVNKVPSEFDIKFKQYLTNRGETWVKKSNQHFLANLKRTKEGGLVSFLTIKS